RKTLRAAHARGPTDAADRYPTRRWGVRARQLHGRQQRQRPFGRARLVRRRLVSVSAVMNPFVDISRLLTRRHFFGRGAGALGVAALASLFDERAFADIADPKPLGALPAFHHAPKAKRVIYLFMPGGPSHIDLFDFKPRLRELHGTELPGSVRMGQRITGMTSGQKSFPCVSPMFDFGRHGKSRAWVSELLPHTASIVDEIAIVKSMHTEAINHDPAFTY